MPWSGGTFTRSNGVFTGSLVWTDDKNAGTKITSAHHDTHDQDLAQGINACLNKNGQNSPTANISWGGYKITSLSYGSADKDSATYGQTITALSIDPTSKVLTASRVQGDITVDLSPITVAGDTSDFARKSLDNIYTGTNDFNSAVNFAGPSGGQSRWVYGGVAILNAYADSSSSWVAYDNAAVIPALKIDTAAQTLSVYGNTLWTSANLTPGNYMTTSGAYTVSGNWQVTGAWAFSQSLQVGGLTIAGSGYSWTASIPSANTLQIAGSGGNFIKVLADAVHTSKLQTQGIGQYWNDSNLAVTTTAPVDPAGATGDIAIVTSGADKGLWVKLSPGGWTKIL